MCTITIQIQDEYMERFTALINELPKEALTITAMKPSYHAEVQKRVDEYYKGETSNLSHSDVWGRLEGGY